MTVSGSASLTAREGSFDDAGVTAQFDLRNAPVGELAREAGSTVEITGTGSASVRVAGSIRQPEANLTMDIQQPAAFGEQLDRLRADAHYRPGELDIANGIANDGTSELRFSGNYRHPEGNLKSGDVNFDVTAQNCHGIADRTRRQDFLRRWTACWAGGCAEAAGSRTEVSNSPPRPRISPDSASRWIGSQSAISR